VIDGYLPPECLGRLQGFAAVALWADADTLRPYRRELAGRDGPILPLITTKDTPFRYRIERLLCVDTTAAGGNAALMSGS
jgi:RHH-type transcriptional regulator, proline utilization regulon repressor / proline dehydrogenase / delta 1-pyrroline-5-carboxylate dehydrogenase